MQTIGKADKSRKYKEFLRYDKNTFRLPPCHMKRLNDDENEIVFKGYWFEVFTDDKMLFPLDVFGGAVGFEILNDSEEERIQYAKDVVDAEEKQYQKLANEIIVSG